MNKIKIIILFFIIILLGLVIYLQYDYENDDNKPYHFINNKESKNDLKESNNDLKESNIINSEITDSTTFWFVVCQNDNGLMFNGISVQNHNYFSVKDAKQFFSNDEHLFIIKFKQIEKVDSTSTNSSYWFVVCQDNNGILYNFMTEQKHLYFSFDEAKNEILSDNVKKIFILDFIEITKETYEKNGN